jgi:DNA mismatch repair protein MutS
MSRPFMTIHKIYFPSQQVALIVYMAQIGCFVPAKHMRLGPVTHIFTLSHAPETAAVSLSQFGIQLTMVTRRFTSISKYSK